MKTLSKTNTKILQRKLFLRYIDINEQAYSLGQICYNYIKR